mmetsp:Transcript_3073/g.8331  ORF Transcript_3073/g.8331 Transcript_3073/m.8331 type:complete len:426 (-) Transcript_3073:1793-3070(-)
MCTIPATRPSDNFSHDGNADMISRGPIVRSQREYGDQGDRDNNLKSAESKTSLEKFRDSIPCVPFSSTFGKSEKLRGIKMDCQTSLRRSMSDGEKPLRRRARSSEGYMPRNNLIENFKDCSYLNTKNEAKIAFPSLSHTGSGYGVRRRKPNKSTCIRNHERSKLLLHRKQEKTLRRSVISLEHPFKIVWDVLTVILSIAHCYLTHMAIRDRQFEASPIISFCQAWFLMDILLNFFTERKTSNGEIISDHRRIVARYLTSWFAVDILSLIPWEALYVKPLIEIQNRRGFFKKSFFRSKAVVRVTTHLRGKHFRWFGAIAKQTKHHGIGAQRLLRLIIKYVPKYIMFLKNMKGVVAVRMLRFVHWSRRSIKNLESTASDASTKSTSCSCLDDDASVSDYDAHAEVRGKKPFEIVYDWETIDDDGIPM